MLDVMQAAVDGTRRDWLRFTRQAGEFHLRTATAWANDRVGEDLTAQIDPEFTLLLVRS